MDWAAKGKSKIFYISFSRYAVISNQTVLGFVFVFNDMLAYLESPPSGCFYPSWLVSWQPLHGFSLRLNGHNALKDMEQHPRSHSWQCSGSSAGHRDVVHVASALPPALTSSESSGREPGRSVPMLIPTTLTAGLSLRHSCIWLVPKADMGSGGTKAAPSKDLAVGTLQGSSGAAPPAWQCWRFPLHLRIYLDII